MFFYVRLNGRIVGRVVAATAADALVLARDVYDGGWGDIVEVVPRTKQGRKGMG